LAFDFAYYADFLFVVLTLFAALGIARTLEIEEFYPSMVIWAIQNSFLYFYDVINSIAFFLSILAALVFAMLERKGGVSI
jgi:hypothetical protein